MSTKYFHLADYLTLEERERIGFTGQRQPLIGYETHAGLQQQPLQLRAKLTGEYRAPRKDEWYLSGAIPQAYRAPADLESKYQIARVVLVEFTTVTTEREIARLDYLRPAGRTP